MPSWVTPYKPVKGHDFTACSTAVVLSRFGTPELERFRDEIIIPRAALSFTVVTIDSANGASGQPDNWYQMFNICTWIAEAFITVTFAGEPYSMNIFEEQLLLRNLVTKCPRVAARVIWKGPFTRPVTASPFRALKF